MQWRCVAIDLCVYAACWKVVVCSRVRLWVVHSWCERVCRGGSFDVKQSLAVGRFAPSYGEWCCYRCFLWAATVSIIWHQSTSRQLSTRQQWRLAAHVWTSTAPLHTLSHATKQATKGGANVKAKPGGTGATSTSTIQSKTHQRKSGTTA
jgi:hypothetical protein